MIFRCSNNNEVSSTLTNQNKTKEDGHRSKQVAAETWTWNNAQIQNQNQNSDGTGKEQQGNYSNAMKTSASHSQDQIPQVKSNLEHPHPTTSDQELLHSLYGHVELLFFTLGMNLKTARYSNKSVQDSNLSNQEVVDSISRIIGDVISSGIQSPVSKYPVGEEVMEDWTKTYVNIDDSKLGANKKYSNILRVVMTYIYKDSIQPIPNHLLSPEKSENFQELFYSDESMLYNNQYDESRNVPRSNFQQEEKKEEGWDPK